MKIYGPVPSWRLGNSLGVDLVEAPKGYNKICSFDCLYCQLGHKGFKTNKLKNINVDEKDLEILKRRIEETKPDYITFSGQGEPTLNLNLGYVAKRIKQMTDIPLAVLTNASFVDDPKIRNGLNYCNLVIAKIDAPTQELFERINQPYEGIILVDIIRGIKMLKAKVAIQTLLFSYDDLTNADDETVKRLIGVYKEINAVKPITIFLGTAYRPGGNENLRFINEDRLKEVASRITEETGIDVIYYKKTEAEAVLRELEPVELQQEILRLLERRPCTEKEISSRFNNVDVSQMLSQLIKEKTLQEMVKGKKRFYCLRG